MLHEFKDYLWDQFDIIAEFLVSFGHIGLAFYTFIETLLIIPPIEIVLIPLVLANPSGWFMYALNVIVFTAISSAIGYHVGLRLGYPLLLKMTSREIVSKTEQMFKKYGILAVAMVAFTPIPYTIAVFMAGIAKMDFKKYMISAMLGRTPRFLIGAYMTAWFGTTENEQLKWLISLIGGGLILIYFSYDQVKRRHRKKNSYLVMNNRKDV